MGEPSERRGTDPRGKRSLVRRGFAVRAAPPLHSITCMREGKIIFGCGYQVENTFTFGFFCREGHGYAIAVVSPEPT